MTNEIKLQQLQAEIEKGQAVINQVVEGKSTEEEALKQIKVILNGSQEIVDTLDKEDLNIATITSINMKFAELLTAQQILEI